jgi:hypothetical protein
LAYVVAASLALIPRFFLAAALRRAGTHQSCTTQAEWGHVLGALALETLWGDEALDLGAADLVLLAVLLGLDCAGNNVLADICARHR